MRKNGTVAYRCDPEDQKIPRRVYNSDPFTAWATALMLRSIIDAPSPAATKVLHDTDYTTFA
jgi:hypothetical protein